MIEVDYDGHTIQYPHSLPEARSPDQIFDRFVEIIKGDQMIHSSYVTDRDLNVDRLASGAVCSGFYFCAVGSAYFSAGVPVGWDSDDNTPEMPESYTTRRDQTEAKYPFLGEVMFALNEVAAERIDSGEFPRLRYLVDREHHGAFETFFEDYLSVGLGEKVESYDVILEVVEEARRRVHEGAVS